MFNTEQWLLLQFLYNYRLFYAKITSILMHQAASIFSLVYICSHIRDI